MDNYGNITREIFKKKKKKMLENSIDKFFFLRYIAQNDRFTNDLKYLET